MNRSTFWMIKYMNGPVFSKARYMNGVGFEILARTPIPKLPLSYPPPPPRPHPRRDFWIKTVWDDVSFVFSVEGMGRIEYSTLSIG